jgi:peptidoglycan/xylan/chitin deacetylase (PgdA/CDA1 family)
MHCLLGRLACFAAALVAAMIPLRAETSRSCWQPAELRARAGEERIAKNIPGAYVRLPATTVSPRRPPVPAGLRGALRRVDLPQGIRRIALTFDLCEQPYEIAGYQGDIVDFLRDRDIAATFFAGGKWLLTHAERASQLMSDDRFEIANHAWEHRNLRLLSGARLATEIDAPSAPMPTFAAASPNAAAPAARPPRGWPGRRGPARLPMT